MHNPDMMKWERAEQLHVIHRAILQFAGSHGGQLPRLNSEKDATQIAEIAKAMIQA